MSGINRILGSSDLEISPIGLGVMQFAGSSHLPRALIPSVPQEDRLAIIRSALEAGINWFDTGGSLGTGRSEELLAEALQDLTVEEGQVMITTSWTAPVGRVGDISRTALARSRYLEPYPITLYQIKLPRAFSSLPAVIHGAADLVEDGLVSFIGGIDFSPDQMRRAQGILSHRGMGLSSNQVRYNLLHREIESNGVLAAARELGVGLIAVSPLASDLLTGKFHRQPQALDNMPSFRKRRLESQLEASRGVIQALENVGVKYSVEPGVVALSWLIHQGQDVFVVPSAIRTSHVQECVSALRTRLSQEDLARLDEAAKGFGKGSWD